MESVTLGLIEMPRGNPSDILREAVLEALLEREDELSRFVVEVMKDKQNP